MKTPRHAHAPRDRVTQAISSLALAAAVAIAAACSHGGVAAASPGSLTILSPTTETTLARGGTLALTCLYTGTTGRPTIEFVADGDGNAATIADQTSLGLWSPASPDPHDVPLDFTGVHSGRHTILATITPAGTAPRTTVAGPTIRIVERGHLARHGGPNDDFHGAAAVAPDGSVMTVGLFSNESTFGTGEPAETTLFDSDQAGFLALHAPDGRLRWARSVGGRGVQSVSQVERVRDGWIVAGLFESEGIYTYPSGSIRLTDGRLFVLRLDEDGNLRWARQLRTTSGNVSGLSVGVDDSIVVAGLFRNHLEAAVGRPDVVTIATRGIADAYCVMFNGDGDLTWARGAGTTGEWTFAFGTSIGHDGRVALVGQFVRSITFEAGPDGTLTGPGPHPYGFAAVYEPNGDLAWATLLGGSGEDVGLAATFLGNGDLAVTGTFTGFGRFGGLSLDSLGDADGFLVRLDAQGHGVWARRFGGTDPDSAYDLAALPDDSLIVSGTFEHHSLFGAGEPRATMLVAIAHGACVAHFTPQGSLRWAMTPGDLGAPTIAASNLGVLVVANLTNEVVVQPGRVLRSAGGSDIAMLWLNLDGSL